MASPEEVTIHNLSGNWTLNKGLSENLDEAIMTHGIPFLVRKILLWATIGETITETKRTDGSKGLIVTKSAGSVKGSADAFDGSGKEVIVQGPSEQVRVTSWWVDLLSDPEPKRPSGEPLDPYLLQDWIEEEPKGVAGHFAGNGVHEKSGVKDNMLWGFCLIGGKRYRAVRYHIRKGELEVRARLVFNWVESR